MSVEDAAVSGNQLKTLEATRDRLAQAIDESTSAMGIASLAKQLQEVLSRIEELTPKNTKGTPLDEFTKRLAEKQANTG